MKTNKPSQFVTSSFLNEIHSTQKLEVKIQPSKEDPNPVKIESKSKSDMSDESFQLKEEEKDSLADSCALDEISKGSGCQSSWSKSDQELVEVSKNGQSSSKNKKFSVVRQVRKLELKPEELRSVYKEIELINVSVSTAYE